MPLLINFKDAVNASVLDRTASHAVFYMDGDFENEAAVRAQCPHAKLYAITVRGATGHGIFACDSETGDLDIPQTEAWTAAQVALNVSPIVDYANQDRWLNLGLLAALAHYGERIERWDADYDGSAVIPSWASAKQYASGNVDLNVALADFFGDAPPVPAPVVPNLHYDQFAVGPFASTWGNLDERSVVEHYDGARQHWVKYKLFLGTLRAQLGFLAGRVAYEAAQNPVDGKASWGVDFRGWRYQQLSHRAQGMRFT